MITLKQKTITGIGWSTVGNVGKQGLQFVISVVLARLLTPEDFGLVGMVLVFTGLATLFNDLGFGTALIQKDNLNEEHLSTVFWLNISVGAFLTLLVIILAPWIASFYTEPQLVPLIRIIAVNFFAGAFGIVQKSLFTRNMQFKVLVVIDFIAVLLAGIIAIFLAVYGLGVWSLIIQLVVFTLVSTLFLWIYGGWYPKLIIRKQAVNELWGFSSNLLGAQLLNYGVRNFDYLLIGRFVGSEGLGIYTRAYTTMLLPINQITAVVGRVMFPALSRIQSDLQKVKDVYLYANRIIALVTIPLMVGLIVVARPFVLTLFGPKWEAVIPILQILCLIGIKQPIGSTVGWIYQSQGRTDLMFRWSAFSILVTIVAFLIGIKWDIIGVSVAYAVRSYLIWYPNIVIPGRLIEMSFKEFLVNVLSVLGCSLGMALITWVLGTRLPTNWPNWLLLIVQITVGIGVYLGLIHLFKLQAYTEAKLLLIEQWRKIQMMPVLKT